MEDKITGFPQRLGYSILLANLVLVIGAGLLFVVGITFGPIWWLLYGFGATLGAALAVKRGPNEGFCNSARSLAVLATLILHAALLFLAAGIASQFLDVGWDSLETHQRAVLSIREGWNIIDPQPGWLNEQPESGLLRKEPSIYTAYLDFNAMYVVSSLLGDLPFGFEGAKGYRLLLLLMAGLLTTDLLRRTGLGKWSARGVGLFVAANPVCLYQLWVLFMDFDVAIYSSLSIVGLYCLSWRIDWRTAGVTLASILLLLVAKRSGLALALPLGALWALWVVGNRLNEWRGRRKADEAARGAGVPSRPSRRGIWIGSGVVLVGLFGLLLVIGISGSRGESRQGAYYSLGFIHRAIFEPDQFDQNLDLFVPASHRGLSRPEQFARSLLEKSGIYRGESVKAPFTWDEKEWSTFRNIHWPGHGSGGFGPLFSGVLILALLAGILTLRPFPPLLTAGGVFRLLLLLALIGICVIVPSWWARWVPFVWVLPLFFMLPPLFLRPAENPRSRLLYADRNHLVPSLCAAGALILALINSGAIFSISTSETAHVTAAIEEALDSVSGTEIVLDPGRNLLTKRWLIERNIPYQLSEDRGEIIFELEPTTARLYQPAVSP